MTDIDQGLPPFGKYVLIKSKSAVEDPNDPEGSKFVVAKRIPVNQVSYVGEFEFNKNYIWEMAEQGFYPPRHVESWSELPR